MSTLTPRIDKIDKNYLINGNFDFWQRTAANQLLVTANRAYGADRWMIFPSIASANGAQMIRATSSNVGSTYDCNIGAWATPLAKVGMAQIIEKANMRSLLNKEVTFSVSAKVNSSTSVIRCEILAWTGTSDAVTSFTNAVPYTNWSTYTLAASFTSVASITSNITTSYNKVVVSGTVPSNANNLICVVSYISGSDQIYLSQAQLIVGDIADPDFSAAGRTIGGELLLCQRYYEKSYTLEQSPATGDQYGAVRVTSNASALGEATAFQFKVTKRAIPTVALYHPASGAINTLYRVSDAAAIGGSSVGFTNQSGVRLITLGSASNNLYDFHWTADAEL